MFDKVQEVYIDYDFKKDKSKSTYSHVGDIIIGPMNLNIRFQVKDDDASADDNIYECVIIKDSADNCFIKGNFFSDEMVYWPLEKEILEDGTIVLTSEDDEELMTITIVKGN